MTEESNKSYFVNEEIDYLLDHPEIVINSLTDYNNFKKNFKNIPAVA